MKIEFSKTPDEIHLAIFEGEMDYRVSSEIRGKLAEFVKSQPAKIVVNLAKVNYMDSSGIAAFVELSQRLRRSGGKMVLCELTKSVRDIFELAKMQLFFTITETQDEALNTLRS